MALVMARFETANASKYLQQLCKHFASKCPAQWTAEEGWVSFTPGTAELHVRPDALLLECMAESNDKLAVLVRLLETYLERVAASEEVNLVWLEDGRPADALNARLRALSLLYVDGLDADVRPATIH